MWNKFVLKLLSIINKDKYLVLVHPSGWRSPIGKFKYIYDVLIQKK